MDGSILDELYNVSILRFLAWKRAWLTSNGRFTSCPAMQQRLQHFLIVWLDHISKHPRKEFKYDALRSIFDELQGVEKFGKKKKRSRYILNRKAKTEIKIAKLYADWNTVTIGFALWQWVWEDWLTFRDTTSLRFHLKIKEAFLKGWENSCSTK